MVDWNTLLSGFIGVFVGSAIAYWGQSRLVNRQIAAAEKTQQELLGLLGEARNMLNTRFAELAGALHRVYWILEKFAKKIDVA